jgi:hypothetical protein
VGDEGVALIAAASTGGAGSTRAFDYYDLFDLVAPEFESVRMVGQLAFHGLALVELGGDDDAPAVSVDTQLAESGRGPEAFVVVASQREARLEPYAIVQLPEPAESEAAPAERDTSVDHDALTQAQLRAELLASQIDDLRARLAESERAAEAVSALEEALRARSSHTVDLEKQLAVRGRELAELSSEVEEMRSAAEAGRIAAVQVEEVAHRADRAERRVAALEQELAKGGDSQARELVEMEQALRERAQAVRALEQELTRREQMVRDLVGTLEDADAMGAVQPERVHGTEPPAAPTPPEGRRPDSTRQAAPPPAPASEAPGEAVAELAEENALLRAQLDAMALDLARREGDAQAREWHVAELERRMAQIEATRDVAVASPPRVDPKLVEALDELDTLRTALSQEHEARIRAESGEELARARAEIERQAVLMEQLARARSGSSEDSR